MDDSQNTAGSTSHASSGQTGGGRGGGGDEGCSTKEGKDNFGCVQALHSKGARDRLIHSWPGFLSADGWGIHCALLV